MPFEFPSGFLSRPYQDPFFTAMGSGCRRAVLVWHRRAGKDVTTWNWCISEAFRKTGTYYYFFPTYSQGKKILWDGFDGQGKKFLHYIPNFDRCKLNETEMQITLPGPEAGGSGSIIQIIGTDKMDYIVGTNPIGCVFSEYSIQNPRAWSLTRPILEENGGWAVFVYTPRGNNHGKRLFYGTTSSNAWYRSLLTINDTQREDGSPIIAETQINEIRAEGEDEDLIQQEYYCAFTGAQQGSFYSKLMNQAEAEGRIRPLSHVIDKPIYTAWDIGRTDATVIGLTQYIHDMVHWIDCLDEKGESLPYFASELDAKRKLHHYRYGHHYFPHDMRVTDYGSGEQRLQVAKKLLGHQCTAIPKLDIYQGIDAVRRRFSTYVFDEKRTEKLRDALVNYTKEWDERNQCFKSMPLHNWASDFADMVRTEASARHRPETDALDRLPRRALTHHDPLAYDIAAIG